MAKKTLTTTAGHDRSKLQIAELQILELHSCWNAKPVPRSFRCRVTEWRHYEKKLLTGPHM